MLNNACGSLEGLKGTQTEAKRGAPLECTNEEATLNAELSTCMLITAHCAVCVLWGASVNANDEVLCRCSRCCNEHWEIIQALV